MTVDRSEAIMQFVGVTTAQSSIRSLFPLLTGELGLGPARLVGRDLPLRAERHRYRAVVADMAADPQVRGALVTAHKVDLYAAARDLFSGLDDYAELTEEISCVAKRGAGLVGHAKDPVTAGRTLRSMLGDGYFGATGGWVLCLGAGGAGLATAVTLLQRKDSADRPERIVLTDVRGERLAAARAAAERIDADTEVECVRTGDATGLLARLPGGSLVVNATGLGKDRPGSPIGAAARFPRGAVVWDFNYRGELDFLAQARAQQEDGGLRIEDGWRYFVNGWAEHTAEVFGVELGPERLDRLHLIADRWRAGEAG